MFAYDLLLRQGGVASTAELLGAGMTKKEIHAAVQNGELERLRKGLYKDTSTITDVGVARMLNGALSCVTALKLHGFWTPHGVHPRHIRINREVAARWQSDPIRRRFAPLDVPHVLPAPWRNRVQGLIDSPLRALLTAGPCLSRDELVAVLDSALRNGLSRVELDQLRPHGTAALNHALELLDPHADSGLESLVRMRLRALRVRVRSQVECVGWPCDLVVGDWLVIELDGLEYHRTKEQIDRDHWKDRQLMLAGSTVLRFTYTDVTQRWEYCEQQIVAVVRSGWHIRPRKLSA